MAYKITSINGQPRSHNTREFLCSTEDDIAKLPRYKIAGTQELENDTISNDPCGIGSTALVCSTSDVYILTPDNEWVKL